MNKPLICWKKPICFTNCFGHRNILEKAKLLSQFALATETFCIAKSFLCQNAKWFLCREAKIPAGSQKVFL